MASKSKDFTIDDLSGGFNDNDPPTSLAPNQCITAENVDFFKSPCGARRAGSVPITIPANLTNKTYIARLFRHLPTTDEHDAQLWAYGVTPSVSYQLAYKDTSWHDVAMADAPLIDNTADQFNYSMVSLHGKLFFAYKTAAAVDRLHVWDGTTLRRTGLLPPAAAPTAADNGAGSFLGIRYYRTRETVQASSVTILRSEPTAVLSFSPSGTGSGAQVTKPTTINSNATHWELEASLNNADFYRIATTVVGTTTFIDTANTAVGYTDQPLSEDVGDYTVIPSGRYLVVDEDRLLIAGSFEDSTAASAVRWTPVYNDPGVGNDERIPIDTDNILNLDGFRGGVITGMAGPMYGTIYVFKMNHIYRLIRTKQRTHAYDAYCLTTTVGALPDSIVEAVDEAGRPAIYFLDPKSGPMRLGEGGILTAGSDILGTWAGVNIEADQIMCRKIYYPNKKQVNWWIALIGSNFPNLRLNLQVDATVVTQSGVRLGWTKHTGGTVLTACLFATNIESNTTRSRNLKPFVAIDNTIQIMDTDHTDNGVAYTSTILTRPYLISESINNKFGIKAASIMGDTDFRASINISLVRDFGVETTTPIEVAMIDSGPGPYGGTTIKQIDDFRMSEAKVVQISITDGPTNDSEWTIYRIDLIPRSEQSG